MPSSRELKVVAGGLRFGQCGRCQQLERRIASASELLGYIYSVLSDMEAVELARARELDVEAFMHGWREGRLRDAKC
jgi:hypothetical protein